MEVVYRAFDGTIFEGADDCRHYEEKSYSGYEIFNYEGDQRPNHRADCACFIHLLDESGYDNFIRACEMRGESHYGLKKEIGSWFHWNGYKDSYEYLSEDVMNAIVKIINSKGNE